MKVELNQENYRRDWKLEHWYEKVFYAVGLIWTVGFVLTFTVAFIVGIVEGL